MIIAVDFDGSLCTDAYPEIGDANNKLIWELQNRQSMGDKLILWTCRIGDKLSEAVSWCENRGLIFDAVNENLQETILKWGSNPRKITADIYIDDRAASPLASFFEMAI